MPPFFCYKCRQTVNVEPDQNLQCPLCHDEFIEEVSASNMMNAMGDDEDDEGPDAVGFEDFMRIFGSTLHQRANQAPSASSSQGTQAGSRPIGGILGQLFNIMQPNSAASSQASEPREPRNGDTSNNAGPQEQGILDFMNQLLANLNANAGHSGATIHFHFGNGTPQNINNYVFGDGAFDQLISHLLNNSEIQSQGLSEEDLKSLPKVNVAQQQVDNGVNCTTCMENFILDEEVVKLPCNHIFHEVCIFPWLKKQNTCPICRSELEHSKKKPTEITDIDDLD